MTRKFCVRCGASLLNREEELTPEPVRAPATEPVLEETVESEEAGVEPPGEVPSDLVKAEKAGPAESHVLDRESGKAVVKDILEKVRAVQTVPRAEPEVKEPTSEVEVVEEIPVEVIEEQPPVEAPTTEPEIEPSSPEPPAPRPKEAIMHDYAPDVPPSAVAEAVYEVARDEKIRSIDSDIKAYTIELGQLNSELDKLRARLDSEVDRYLTVAETKRTHFEGLERELSLAKNEYKEASKEHKNSEKRRKKELSEAEKRIRNSEKRIKKAENARQKRVDKLEKERRKREEEAMRD